MDFHDICGLNIPLSVLHTFLQVVIGVVEEFEKIGFFFGGEAS